MRPISFLSKDELSVWGDEQLNTLINQYGHSKQHVWKEGAVQHIKEVEPFINPELVKIEWEQCKRVVLAEMFPRDSMVQLWQLIAQYHKDEFPNLICLAALALTCPTNTADCERSFSVQNYITTQKRANISAHTCDQLMRVCITWPKLKDMDFSKAVKLWQSQKRRYLYTSKK